MAATGFPGEEMMYVYTVRLAYPPMNIPFRGKVGACFTLCI
jgi:hypothetical protein